MKAELTYSTAVQEGLSYRAERDPASNLGTCNHYWSSRRDGLGALGVRDDSFTKTKQEQDTTFGNRTRNGRLGAAGGQQAVLWLCAARGISRERREARLPPAGRGEPGRCVAAAGPQAESSPPREGSGKLPPRGVWAAAAGSGLLLQTAVPSTEPRRGAFCRAWSGRERGKC